MLRGELDLSTMGIAEQALHSVQRTPVDTIVIDLSRLTFVDSSGVRLVLCADQYARAVNRRAAVLVGTGPARRLFAMLGLLDRLDVLDKAAAPDPV